METFDKFSVLFVSVTQHFNTTHSMGQLSEFGEDALSPGEIDAIEEIVLPNYRVRPVGPLNSYIIHGADDYFAGLKRRGGSLAACERGSVPAMVMALGGMPAPAT